MNRDSILDALDVAVYAKDRDGRYTYVNRYVCELFKLTADEIVGHDDSHFFDLEQSNALKINDAEVMASGKPVEREERDVVKATGEERLYWTVKSPVRDASGAVVGLCGMSVDITATRR
ncbi:MAG: hypothetical protein RL760_991 [Candidatus Eisenbacteria bacterium]|jgi:PAS domain S-box-containing protein